MQKKARVLQNFYFSGENKKEKQEGYFELSLGQG